MNLVTDAAKRLREGNAKTYDAELIAVAFLSLQNAAEPTSVPKTASQPKIAVDYCKHEDHATRARSVEIFGVLFMPCPYCIDDLVEKLRQWGEDDE